VICKWTPECVILLIFSLEARYGLFLSSKDAHFSLFYKVLPSFVSVNSHWLLGFISLRISWDINALGQAVYSERYLRTFGFYQERAAIQAADEWWHILITGLPLSGERYAWCGNFQEGRCPVRLLDYSYVHLQLDGTVAYSQRYRYVGDYRDGMAVVQRDDGLHTHITLRGELVHRQWLLDLDVFHKGFARACDSQGWYHLDIRGQPLYLRRFASVDNGQARVEELDGSLLIIDEQGRTKVKLRHGIGAESQ
jgi:hypothetical protein